MYYIFFEIIKYYNMFILALQKAFCRYSSGYSKSINLATTSSTFYSKLLVKQSRSKLLELPNFDPQSLPFGKFHTDYMISVDYQQHKGWSVPKIHPYQDLIISPFSSSLHYGLQTFQGTKAYKNEKGQIRLFRPECNVYRLTKSSQRLMMPDFDGGELLNLIEQLVKTESRWIPPISQYSLYIRPLHISTHQYLGIQKPTKTKLMIMASPVGPYYPSGFKPISLYCAAQTIRSAPKGTGAYKIGGNYAPTIKISTQVASKGHQQVLWLFGQKVIEVGSSNIFFIFKNSNGDIQIVTPQLEDLVLPGITRDSILELLRDQKQYKVTQRQNTITQVIERQTKGELIQVFGTGTAVIISSIKNIEYLGVNYEIPVDKNLNCGAISYKIWKKLLEIQQGRAADRFGWVKRIL